MLIIDNNRYKKYNPMLPPTLSISAAPYDGISLSTASTLSVDTSSASSITSSSTKNPNNGNLITPSPTKSFASYSSACGNDSIKTATTATSSTIANTIAGTRIRKRHQSLPQCHPRLPSQQALPPRYPYTVQPHRSPPYQSNNHNNYNNNNNNNNTNSSTKVKPYRFRDEPQKKIIVKTELCRAILEGKPCRFGAKCNFAHDETELKYKTLVERHDAGLIDKETYRTRPCLDHIMVGDCPMSLRCTCLHDPRISAKSEQNQWWLPHCALQSTHLDVDVHVDWYGKYNFSLSHYGHPFGKGMNKSNILSKVGGEDEDDHKSKDHSILGDWDNFYRFVINADSTDMDSSVEGKAVDMTWGDIIANHDVNKTNYVSYSSVATSSFWSMPTSKGTSTFEHAPTTHPTTHPIPITTLTNANICCNYRLTESQKLQITLAMRHEFKDLDNIYKYQPTHKILNEICMLIQTKAFDVSPSNGHHSSNNSSEEYKSLDNGANDTIKTIPVEQFDPINPNHVIVREIAFGPLCSPNDRPLALWFNILDRDVQVCTAKERLRPKRTERKLLDKKNLASLQCKLIPTPLVTTPMSASMGYHGSTGSGMNGNGNMVSANSILGNGSSSGSSRSGTITYAQVIGNQNNIPINSNQHQCNSRTTTVSRYIPVSFDDDHHHLEKQFHIYCPKDEAAFKLVSDTLTYRLKVIRWNNNTTRTTTQTVGRNLLEFKQRLEDTFSSLQSHFSHSYWPVNRGRENVDEHMLIPKVDTEYVLSESANIYQRGIWESFVKTASEGFQQCNNDNNRNQYHAVGRDATTRSTQRRSRFPVFKKLSEEKSPCDDSTTALPYIKRRIAPPGFSDTLGIFSNREEKDWGTVRTHYLSKKTQQQHGK